MGAGLTIANSTWYHVFAIINTGAADAYFDTSITAANKPASTTYFRRIGSFLTDGSARILAFFQTGDQFTWVQARSDVNTSALGTTPTSYALTVPTGLKVVALFRGAIGSAGYLSINGPDETLNVSGTPSGNVSLVGATGGNAGHFAILTNTSAQIMAVADAASRTFYAVTYGWIDTRGRLA